MAGLRFGIPFANVAITSTAATIVGFQMAANQCGILRGIFIGCHGTDASKGPALIEVCTCTFATNAPGTNSSAVTPVCTNARTETIQALCGKVWTVEPTVVAVAHNFPVPTCMGSAVLYYPLSAPLFVAGGKGACVRVTGIAAYAVNATGALDVEE